jgi:hypothetical protein
MSGFSVMVKIDREVGLWTFPTETHAVSSALRSSFSLSVFLVLSGCSARPWQSYSLRVEYAACTFALFCAVPMTRRRCPRTRLKEMTIVRAAARSPAGLSRRSLVMKTVTKSMPLVQETEQVQ